METDKEKCHTEEEGRPECPSCAANEVPEKAPETLEINVAEEVNVTPHFGR